MGKSVAVEVAVAVIAALITVCSLNAQVAPVKVSGGTMQIEIAPIVWADKIDTLQNRVIDSVAVSPDYIVVLRDTVTKAITLLDSFGKNTLKNFNVDDLDITSGIYEVGYWGALAEAESSEPHWSTDQRLPWVLDFRSGAVITVLRQGKFIGIRITQ